MDHYRKETTLTALYLVLYRDKAALYNPIAQSPHTAHKGPTDESCLFYHHRRSMLGLAELTALLPSLEMTMNKIFNDYRM